MSFHSGRRKFLLTAGVGGAALSTAMLTSTSSAFETGFSGERLASTGKSWTQLSGITIDDVLPHVGQHVTVCDEGGRSKNKLVLVDVSATPVKSHGSHKLASGTRTPFSMLFRLQSGKQLSSGVHHLSHRELKETSLLLNEVGPDEHYYEACIS